MDKEDMMLFKCIICREEKEESERSEEHVVMDSLGGTLVFNDVCKKCNNDTGSKVDAKLLNYFEIRSERMTQKIPSKSGEIPSVAIEGDLVSDPRVKTRYIMGPEGVRLMAWGKEVKGDEVTYFFDGDTFLKVDTERLREKCIKRGFRKISFGIITLKDPERGVITAQKVREKLNQDKGSIKSDEEIHPEISGSFRIPFLDFQPAIAKMAYEYAYLKLGKEYLDDEGARILLDFILEEDASKRKKIPLRESIFPMLKENQIRDALFSITERHHLLAIVGNAAIVVLFGKIWGILQIFEGTCENLNKYALDSEKGFVTIMEVEEPPQDYPYQEFVAKRLEWEES